MEQTTEAVNKSRFAKEEPTNFGKKEEDTKGHSFPVEGVGGVYTKPDGTRVFVKPVLDETAALAEQRYNAIHQGAHRLTPPQQEIRVMIDPTDPAGKRKLLVLESPYDPRFANMDGLKDTTIGKIAKEIIEDIDLSKIKQSISEEGDIFKAIAKPDSGFGELFTNVSQKMSSKISSGELSQDAIMKDAMKFASIIPGLFGNAGGGGADGENTPGGGFDMMSMMNLMKEMNQGGAFGGAGAGGAKKQRSGVNNQALRSLMKKQQLQKKLNN
jgi:hypothetical protein